MPSADTTFPHEPRTRALRRALDRALGDQAPGALAQDLLFLEEWEARPSRDIGVALRVHQIRRANPELAAAIRAELSGAQMAAAD